MEGVKYLSLAVSGEIIPFNTRFRSTSPKMSKAANRTLPRDRRGSIFEDLFYHQFVCCNAGGDAKEKQYDGDYEHHLHCFPVFPGIILLSEILFMVKILHKRYLDLS